MQKEEFEFLKQKFKEENIDTDLNRQMEGINSNKGDQNELNRMLSNQNQDFFEGNESPRRILSVFDREDNEGDNYDNSYEEDSTLYKFHLFQNRFYSVKY